MVLANLIETIASASGGARGAAQALLERVRDYTDSRSLTDNATLVAGEYLGTGLEQK